MKLSEFIMSCQNVYNGHFQTQINYMTLGQALELIQDLEEDNPQYLFQIEIMPDGSFSIVQCNFWPHGSYNGNKDRTLLSVESSNIDEVKFLDQIPRTDEDE